MMEEMYGLHPGANYPEQPPPLENMLSPPDYRAFTPPAFRDWFPIFGSGQMFSASPAESDSSSMVAEIQRSGSEEELSDVIRTRIVSHPLYPKLLEAYIDCQKVGASPEIVYLLDEIRRENDLGKRTAVSTSLGTDPELDEFMEAYCNMLTKCKSDLARPFEEATSFFNNIERQLSNLCDGTSRIFVSGTLLEAIGRKLVLSYDDRPREEGKKSLAIVSSSDKAAGSFEERFSEGLMVQDSNRTAEDQELKEKLIRKYSGYISCLKHEFSKKKKKGKLPKESTKMLLDWWTAHYKWPYPTEADKIALAESTGLDQKQINNWFINQRKRHWKPSGDMQHAVIDSLYGPFLMNDGGGL